MPPEHPSCLQWAPPAPVLLRAGGPFQTRKRRFMQPLLYLEVAVWVLLLGFTSECLCLLRAQLLGGLPGAVGAAAGAALHTRRVACGWLPGRAAASVVLHPPC